MAKEKPVKVNTPKKPVQYSPAQKAFRNNLRKIDKLKMKLWFIRQATALCKEAYLTKIDPLQEVYVQKRAEIVKLFHQAYPRLSSKLQKQAEVVIERLSFILIEEGCKELEAIHDQYADMTIAEVEEQKNELSLSLMRGFFETVSGNVDVSDIGKDAKTPEEYKKAVMEAFNSEAFQEQFEQAQTASKSKTRKKRDEKIEARHKEAFSMMNKTLRSLYVELVKEHHPDREQNETLKLEKTDLMKKITEAYEKNDLATLLELQITYLEKEEEAFVALPDERLKIFNKIFSQQIAELSQQVEISKLAIPGEIMEDMEYYKIKDLGRLSALLKREEGTLKRYVRKVEEDIAACRDLKFLKKMIKELYNNYKEEDEESAFFSFG
jgi:hypothetical protein